MHRPFNSKVPSDVNPLLLEQVGDAVFYRLECTKKVEHFGVLQRAGAGDDSMVVWSKFGKDNPVFEHGLHAVPCWYGSIYSVRRAPGCSRDGPNSPFSSAI